MSSRAGSAVRTDLEEVFRRDYQFVVGVAAISPMASALMSFGGGSEQASAFPFLSSASLTGAYLA